MEYQLPAGFQSLVFTMMLSICGKISAIWLTHYKNQEIELMVFSKFWY